MEVESIRHKALRAFFTAGRTRGLPGDLVERLRKMLAFIVDAESADELATPPNYGFHGLTGDRTGEYAMTVTRNWRLTFTMPDEQTVADLDLEDYH